MQTLPIQHLSPLYQLGHASDTLVGQSAVFQDLLDQVHLVAPTDCRVLLAGPAGSGKETLARAIHNASERHASPFYKINCGDFDQNYSQTPLHYLNQEGSPQSALNALSPIELVRGGTLYLHEVGLLTSDSQTWLLRSLLAMEMESLNNPGTSSKDEIRIISSTSQNLHSEVITQRFRSDLFYRLNVVPLQIPSLCSRLEDIPLLLHHFVTKLSGKYGKSIENISQKTLELLNSYSWPGNIKELENVIERAIILSKNSTLHIEQISLAPTNFPLHS